MPYVYARPDASPHAAVLGPIQNVENDYELVRGVSRATDWPSDASFKMDPDFGLLLDDVVKCLGSLLVISEDLRAFLSAEELPGTEVLPVQIIDHKDRPVEAEYFVLHQTDLQDVLDLDASGAQMNPINPKIVRKVDQLVIDPSAIDPEAGIFRLAKYPRPILFTEELADRILEEGFTGIGFAPINDFDRFKLL